MSGTSQWGRANALHRKSVENALIGLAAIEEELEVAEREAGEYSCTWIIKIKTTNGSRDLPFEKSAKDLL